MGIRAVYMMEMTDALIEEFRSSLLELKAELEESLVGLREMSKPVAPDDAIGRLSRVDAMQQQKMAQNQRASAEARLRLIHAALDAMARDEYGICRVCEEEIDHRRLKARPESMVCVRCQSAQGG